MGHWYVLVQFLLTFQCFYGFLSQIDFWTNILIIMMVHFFPLLLTNCIHVGHSYVTYGPLLNRAQRYSHCFLWSILSWIMTCSVLFEGIPTYPDAGRSWQIIQKYKVTQFYTGMNVVRVLKTSI